MIQFHISVNRYLSRKTNAFYHVSYTGFQTPGNPDYINVLKNTFNNTGKTKLQSAAHELQSVLQEDFPQIYRSLGFDVVTVCVVPRAKSENAYHANQQLFRS